MITYAQALGLLQRHLHPLPANRRPLELAGGHFLAQEVRARGPAPRFDQSNVDGYGVYVEDVIEATRNSPACLPLAGTLAAGGIGKRRLKRGTTMKLFTGAPVPQGVEAVIMKEFCTEQDGQVRIGTTAEKGENVRRRGEEFKKGARLLAAGTRVTPPVVGLLAALGYALVRVHPKPTVSVIVTGDELVPPGKVVRAGQIYESNSYALRAALEYLGIDPVRVLCLRDDLAQLSRALTAALADSDVILTVGGMSVGEFDFVKEAARGAGIDQVFWRVAIKPGMPSFFGVYQRASSGRTGKAAPKLKKRWLFGLPGNPVSALVAFHQLVRPGLYRLMGAATPQPAVYPASLKVGIEKKPGRLEWVRGKLRRTGDQLYATPTEGQKSHMSSGLAAADCLIELPAETGAVSAGQAVWVIPLSW